MWKRFRWRPRREREAEDRELAEELSAHLAIEERQRIADGEAPADAAAEARSAFGTITRSREETREVWGWAAWERGFDDVRYGIRMLRKTPAWTAVMTATLVLGIALATATFSLVYSLLLQPLPYPQSDRLVALWSSAPERGYGRFHVSAANWLDWRAQARSFEDIALT